MQPPVPADAVGARKEAGGDINPDDVGLVGGLIGGDASDNAAAAGAGWLAAPPPGCAAMLPVSSKCGSAVEVDKMEGDTRAEILSVYLDGRFPHHLTAPRNDPE